MHNRYKLFTPFILLLFSIIILCCNSNAGGKNYKINSLQPFEIILRSMPNLPCTGAVCIITDKSIIINFDEEYNLTDSSGNNEFICKQKKVFEKNLIKTNELIQLSLIDPNNLEAIPHESCEGGVSYSITFKKAGKEKEIYYGGCAKEFDENTIMIVKYINSQVPNKYKIDL